MRSGAAVLLLSLLALLAAACTDVTGVPRDAAGAAEVSTPASTAASVPSSSVTTVPAATTTTTPATTTTVAGPREWNLLAGGDVLMDRSEPAGVEVFAGIEPALASADLALVNVEMAISDRGSPVDKQFVFRAPPAAAERIAAAGVDVVSLANNHARDFGAAALSDTVAHLRNAGVEPIGAGASRAEAFAAASVDVDGVTVGVVGISFIVPGGFTATSERSGIASGHDLERAVAAVSTTAEGHDLTVVFVHWGIERETCPSGRQRDQAAALAAAGADVIIGAHPHVLQPIETLDDGTLVAWSLGNFVWHPRSGQTGETAVLDIAFTDTEIVSVIGHPHVLDGSGAPIPVAEGRRAERIRDILDGNCARHALPPLPTTTTTDPAATTTTLAETPTTETSATETSTTETPTTAPPVETTTTVATEPDQSLPPPPEPVTTLPPGNED